jgi:hypothetical protein
MSCARAAARGAPMLVGLALRPRRRLRVRGGLEAPERGVVAATAEQGTSGGGYWRGARLMQASTKRGLMCIQWTCVHLRRLGGGSLKKVFFGEGLLLHRPQAKQRSLLPPQNTDLPTKCGVCALERLCALSS